MVGCMESCYPRVRLGEDRMKQTTPFLAGLVLLAAPAVAQDGAPGRWYAMATGGDAPPAAGAPDEGTPDPDVLFDLADRTDVIAAELASLRTDDGVRGHQREVEERLTALIGMLEREGG